MESFNIKFVGEVEKHPELYDSTRVEYSRKDCVEKAWNEIAEEVNLSAVDCKEKWRNLRSTFVKNLKPKTRGSGTTKRKPYYLMEALQFALPFVKIAGTPTGNLPKIPEVFDFSITPELKKMNDNDEDPLKEEELSESQGPPTDQDYFSSSPSSPQPSTLPQSCSRMEIRGESVSPTGHMGRAQASHDQSIKKRKYVNVSNDADNASDEYSAKAAKLANHPSTNDRWKGIQNFQDSLIPDLIQMNDVQLRSYKRKTLFLIDEVMGTLPETLCYPSTSTACYYHSTKPQQKDHDSV